MNAIYLSTGAFIGNPNSCDHTLLTRHAGDFNCDGFELLVHPGYYPLMQEIIDEYRKNKLPITVVHADKEIADYISTPGSEAFARALGLFAVNCKLAHELKVKTMVLHGWGIPPSDEYKELIYERLGLLNDIAAESRVDLLIENCACSHGSPLAHMETLAELYPQIGFSLDTRFAEFHGELEAVCNSSLWEGRIRIVHAGDYKGNRKDWSRLHPILPPPAGQIDWTAFFTALQSKGYNGPITLESPSLLESGVDAVTLNNGVEFIRGCLGAV